LRANEVARDVDGAGDRLIGIGDGTSAPSADLVAEQPEPSGPSRSDRAFGDDTTLSSTLVPDRRGLADEPAVRYVYRQSRMVEIAPRAMFSEGCDRFVDLAIQPDQVTARAQGDPKEVDCWGGRASSTQRRARRAPGSMLRPPVFTWKTSSTQASSVGVRQRVKVGTRSIRRRGRPSGRPLVDPAVVAPYGVGSAYEPPKMSLFPKVAGQSCWMAGRPAGYVLWSAAMAARHASTAGQSAAFRTSFHTATP
jgi:hypothetical protein